MSREHDQTDLLMLQFAVGDRVQIAAHFDRWMAGDRFGTVTAVKNHFLYVKMDKSQATIAVVPKDLRGVEA